MLGRTMEVFESLVERWSQADPIKIKYHNEIVYMTLTHMKDGRVNCNGVRWSKFKFNNSNNRVWLNHNSIGQIYEKLMERMDDLGQYKYKELTEIAKKVASVRRELVKKKKLILGTLLSFEKKRIVSYVGNMKRSSSFFYCR